ncbi:protein of unknown function [Agreia sp. COWG]|nr:protein of unknown function [Agreia sp. COWG]
MAGPRHLPRPHGRQGTLGARGGQDAHPQRLDRVLPADPRALGLRRRVDDDPVPLEQDIRLEKHRP